MVKFYGFRKGTSCLTNLLVYFEEATKCFDVSRAYDIVYLDFQKTFDEVVVVGVWFGRRLQERVDARLPGGRQSCGKSGN